jgi:hypothetical protein
MLFAILLLCIAIFLERRNIRTHLYGRYGADGRETPMIGRQTGYGTELLMIAARMLVWQMFWLKISERGCVPHPVEWIVNW